MLPHVTLSLRPGQRCPGFLFPPFNQDELAQVEKDQEIKGWKKLNDLEVVAPVEFEYPVCRPTGLEVGWNRRRMKGNWLISIMP